MLLVDVNAQTELPCCQHNIDMGIIRDKYWQNQEYNR